MKMLVSFFLSAVCLCSCINVNVRNDGGGKTVKCKGEIIEQTMDFTGFTAITVEGAARIDFVQADEFKLLVKANEDVFDYLDYYMRDTELVLSTKDHITIQADEYKLLIQAPAISPLKVEGAAQINIDKGYVSDKEFAVEIDGAATLDFTGIVVPSLDLVINGAGKFALRDIQVGTLEAEINGAGSGSISGVADSAKLTVAGAGNINVRKLQCPNIEKHAEGLAVIR